MSNRQPPRGARIDLINKFREQRPLATLLELGEMADAEIARLYGVSDGWGVDRDLAALPGGTSADAPNGLPEFDHAPADAAVLATVSARLRDARRVAGFTQEALGARLGVTQTAISYWESGKRDPGVTDLLRFAETLGVHAASLLPTPQPESERSAARDIEEGILRKEVDCWRSHVAHLRAVIGAINRSVRSALGEEEEEAPPAALLVVGDVEKLARRYKRADREADRLKRIEDAGCICAEPLPLGGQVRPCPVHGAADCRIAAEGPVAGSATAIGIDGTTNPHAACDAEIERLKSHIRVLMQQQEDDTHVTVSRDDLRMVLAAAEDAPGEFTPIGQRQFDRLAKAADVSP